MVSLLRVPSSDPRYDPDDYSASQAFGAQDFSAGLDGTLFASVRRPPYPCLALYRPSAVTRCVSGEVLAYVWDGRSIEAETRSPLEWEPEVWGHRERNRMRAEARCVQQALEGAAARRVDRICLEDTPFPSPYRGAMNNLRTRADLRTWKH